MQRSHKSKLRRKLETARKDRASLEKLKLQLEIFLIAATLLSGIFWVYISCFYLFKVKYIPLFSSSISLFYIIFLGFFLALLSLACILAFFGPCLIFFIMSPSFVKDLVNDNSKHVLATRSKYKQVLIKIKSLLSSILSVMTLIYGSIYLIFWALLAHFLLIPLFERYIIRFLLYPFRDSTFSISFLWEILIFILVLLINYLIYKKIKRDFLLTFILGLCGSILIVVLLVIIFVNPQSFWYPLKRLNLYGDFEVCFKQKNILEQIFKECNIKEISQSKNSTNNTDNPNNIIMVTDKCISAKIVNNFGSILLKCNSSYLEVPSSEIYLISKKHKRPQNCKQTASKIDCN